MLNISIAFRRWETASKIKRSPLNGKFITKSTFNGSYKKKREKKTKQQSQKCCTYWNYWQDSRYHCTGLERSWWYPLGFGWLQLLERNAFLTIEKTRQKFTFSVLHNKEQRKTLFFVSLPKINSQDSEQPRLLSGITSRSSILISVLQPTKHFEKVILNFFLSETLKKYAVCKYRV